MKREWIRRRTIGADKSMLVESRGRDPVDDGQTRPWRPEAEGCDPPGGIQQDSAITAFDINHCINDLGWPVGFVRALADPGREAVGFVRALSDPAWEAVGFVRALLPVSRGAIGFVRALLHPARTAVGFVRALSVAC
jgi:hypothetical protein